MAASPVRFLFGFLMVCITLWLVFIFASRLVALILSKVVGASVSFRVGGWKCLRDVVVKFRKGAVESVSIGEIRLSLRQSLAKIGVGFISREPKLQILICDLEIVMRPSTKGTKKSKTKKARSHSSGRGKWTVLANVAPFLSVSLMDFVVKTHKLTVELKELKLDISKDGESNSNLFVKLRVLPILIHMCESCASFDQSSSLSSSGYISVDELPLGAAEKSSAPFSCEDFLLSCEFAHNGEVGVIIQNLEIASGEVTMNLNEELLSKKKSKPDAAPHHEQVSTPDAVTKAPVKNQSGAAAIMKYISIIPEKACFSLPKLTVRFAHQEHDLMVENNIMGIQLKSIKSRSMEEDGESTRLDIQMECSEIHLFREAGTSIVEILKVDTLSLVYIPVQPTLPIRAEIDVKLGGSQCKIIMGRLKPWLRLQQSKKKKMVLREEKPSPAKSQSSESKAFAWTSTISAPELTLVVYSIDGLPVYHGCSQSLHLFGNNVSTLGTTVHMELGELNLHMADEYQEYSKEIPFSVDSNSGALVHVAKVGLDWGKKDAGSTEENGAEHKLVLSVDVTGMGIHLDFKRVESLIVTAMSIQAFFKSFSTPSKRTTQSKDGQSSKSSRKGNQLMKFSLERCSVNFCGDAGLENAVVADPKRVNYGSQGGCIVISVSDDGTPRTAKVISTVSEECKKLKYTISLDIFNLVLSSNKENQSAEVELERARSIYQEYLEENKVDTLVTLFDVQNSKLVRRSGGPKGISVCSLFSATDIKVRWEPDLHLSLVELMLRIKLLVHNQKLHQRHGNENKEYMSAMKDSALESGNLDKHKRKESVFAIDVEMLTISAQAGDGVDAIIQVQSIFSENACIGVLLEGLLLRLNGSRVLRSSRMQISRVPSSSSIVPDAKAPTSVTWEWVIQGLDIHICLPYRLELRAIDDSFEDMLRALKLVTAAKTELIFPFKKESSKPKKTSMLKLGRVRFCIRKLIADIEEEPLQGWLDEHYRLMKNEACEQAVRLNFLDKFITRHSVEVSEMNDSGSETKFIYNGEEIDINDQSTVLKMKEDIYAQTFRSYYQACQKLNLSEGSGACQDGFQAGFRPSLARTSLLSITATDLDVSLTKIDGGEAGMIEVLKTLDPVCCENDIPFSRLYGGNLVLRAGTLVVQLRDYKYPLFAGTSGKCECRLILAQQATSFQPQIRQDVFIGRWRKVDMLRSASGTTPPLKSYFDLPLHFQTAEVSFGVGYEPPFADVSYAFTVALRRANLSIRNPGRLVLPPKKERSLPWWDDMRNYIHGKITLSFDESRWHILATTDPYEKRDRLKIVSSYMEIQQSDGRVHMSAKKFKIFTSSLDNLADRCGLKLPPGVAVPFLEAPMFTLEVLMVWECESGTPLNHYLFSLPVEGKPREKVFDPFRSTSLSLRWNFSLRPFLPSAENHLSSTPSAAGDVQNSPPTFNVGAHDLAWALKFWNLNYLPPHKLRMFSRFPRYGVPRIVRSGNLSLDKVMTEFFFRIDATPTAIKHVPLHNDDPAKGLTFNMSKLKYELCWSRGKQKYTFDCRRETLDLVYQGLDLHMPKVVLEKEDVTSIADVVQMTRRNSPSSSADKRNAGCSEKWRDDGFFLSCDYFTIRRQAPKADPARLLAWQEAGRRNLEMTYVKSEFEHSSESDDHTRSDPSDDDGYNVVIADNCQRVFVYGLKLLWTIENRDAVWSFVGGLSKAFAPPKPSPSRLYAQRKLLEEKQPHSDSKVIQENDSKFPSSVQVTDIPSDKVENSESFSASIDPANTEKSPSAAVETNQTIDDNEEEGTRHFMVNVIEPQFNLHSEDANGRFLLAAVSGRVLARSFHSVLRVGHEIIEQALGNQNVQLPESTPEMTWKRMEFSVMLEHVQAHVAPTDVDPGAGLQWLPKIRRSSPKVKRTGALLERVFMPCDMYFRYTRHKGGTPDLKVKPLKELTFNCHNLTATMTSRQFQVMLDVLTNLLFARLPKPKRSSLSYPAEDDEDVEEEADEMVPDGVEEVELAKVNLEHKEREVKILLDDVKRLSLYCDTSVELSTIKEGDMWMIIGGISSLVQGLKKELVNAKKQKKAASSSLRTALQKAAQIRLMEKEKNKSPSFAMRISLQISKVVWSMLIDGKSFAEAEINDMIFDFDRDYKDIGVALFTTKSFVVRNCLPNAKSDMVLSPWNPPPDWGKKAMLRVDAKQAVPREGVSRIELFQVEIYPLKIYLTDPMYRMMWGYFFPEEEQDSQRRQEVWRFSTTSGARRIKKGSSTHEVSSSSHATKEPEMPSRITGASGPELRRTSSFDRTWEETVAESVATELVLQGHSPSISSSKNEPLGSVEHPDDPLKNKPKDTKPVRSGRSPHEEKKVGKTTEEKRPRKMMEFQNIKISQVELQLTYESSRFNLHELKLLMDTFHRAEFTGSWRRLFSRVKKHVVWGTLKSVTGMQGKKFKENSKSQQEANAPSVPDAELINLSDDDGDQAGKGGDQYPIFLKRDADGAGDGFVTSIRGLFNTQRRKAKAFVLRTMRGEAENDFHGEWSESEADFSPFARQLTITKAKRLIRRHTKKFRPSRTQKGSSSQQKDSLPSSPQESIQFGSDSSSEASPFEDFQEQIQSSQSPRESHSRACNT